MQQQLSSWHDERLSATRHVYGTGLCQHGLANGIGFDAPPGTFQKYLAGTRPNNESCSPVSNRTLTTAAQAGACQQNIKLMTDLYNGGWDEGACIYFSEHATLILNSQGDGAFHRCPIQARVSASATPGLNSTQAKNTASPPATSTSTSASQVTGDNHDQSLSGGAVAGIAIGITVIVAAIIAVIGFIVYLHRRSRKEDLQTHMPAPAPISTSGTSAPAMASREPFTTFFGGGRRAELMNSITPFLAQPSDEKSRMWGVDGKRRPGGLGTGQANPV
ncbi:hypothetical protein L218DRAFT_1027785 [Marasmius fiardii PR-910]|nr:hypothetical protein L218DRAFT_1027785 [Marasmius fiardii PR-910]